jgi:hypothetical protein
MNKFVPVIVGVAIGVAAAIVLIRKTSVLDSVAGLAAGTTKS